MYKSRKPIALFLTVMLCITLVTAHYSKTQVHGATETIVAPFVLDAVVKLLVVVSGAYLVDYLNENYDMELERSDVSQTITAVKTLFDIFRTTDGFKLMDKQTGEELSISADTSSVAGHMITGTTPDDAHDRAFYQWYNQNVSKKLGQYHIRVRQWSDTYGQYIDQFHAADNPLQLHQYVPTEYKDDFLQLFADMQEMVKSGFESNGYEKGFISSPLADNQVINLLSGEKITLSEEKQALLEDVIEYMNDPNIYMSEKYIQGRTVALYVTSSGFKLLADYISNPLDFNVFTDQSSSLSLGYRYSFTFSHNPDGTLNSDYSSVSSSVSVTPYTDFPLIYRSPETILLIDSVVVPWGSYEEESSPVTLPLFPPVLDDSGNVALDHGDVQEVPVEEDQDGVPFVPDDWWTSVFDDFFGQTIPGDYDGSLTDMTQTQLLQEIASNTKPPNFTIVDLDAIYEKLKEKFGMFYQIKEFFEAIMNEDYSNPQRPQFTITFTGQLGIYGTYEYLNLDLYDQYRDYIFAFIVATGWFVTLKRIFGYIPKVLN